MRLLMVSGIVLALLAPSGQAAAQGRKREAEDVHLRSDCRLASEVLTTGTPRPHWRWAIETIYRCDESGAVVLAYLWASPPTDSFEIRKLVYASRSLRDLRVLDAVLEAAESESASQLTRLSALRVLASYVETAAEPDLINFEVAANSWPRPGIPRTMPMHVVRRDGSQPPGVDSPWQVWERLGALAKSAGDDRVRDAADYLYEGLRYYLERRKDP
jgi:hypothetical protein